MKREEIINMAREAGIDRIDPGMPVVCSFGLLERFAEIVSAAERSDCATECEQEAGKWPHPSHGNAASAICAAAIRERGFQ